MLKMVDVEYIKKRHDEGWGVRKIARRLEVSRQTVRKVPLRENAHADHRFRPGSEN